MNTGQISVTKSHSSEQTERLAESLGSRLRGGEVLELISDLGGGKTTFVRGLARGLGSADRVSSPSFTLSNEYHSAEHTLFHFDFYRLNEPGIMRDELSEIIHDPQAITVVEWADIVDDVLPLDKLTVRIKTISENDREITYEYPATLKYLVEAS